MAARDTTPVAPLPSPVLVRAALERILSHPAFSGSATLSRMLRYLVEETLAGNGPQLKEYAIGARALGRGESFDPRVDPIVRVQARNLRGKLAQYYAAGGAGERVRIELPKGSYVPVFRTEEPSGAADRAVVISHRRVVLPVAAVLVLTITGAMVAVRAHRGPARLSVAVLPFADLSPDQDQRYFAQGLAEELVSTLAEAGGLRVAANPPAAGEPQADRVVQGSVRKDGQRLRVTVKVEDRRGGDYVWARSYDREAPAAIGVQQEISRAVLEQIRPELRADGRRGEGGNAQAEKLYASGRYLYRKQDEDSLRKSIVYFERAAEADPAYARAYSGIADAWNLLVQHGYEPAREGMPRAKAAAEKAVSLDPKLAEAHLSLAMVLEAFDWQWAAAEREYKTALDLDAQLPPAWYWYGMFLRDRGRLEEARPYLERGYELDPASVLAGVNLAHLYSEMGKNEAALELMQRAADLEPKDANVRLKLAFLYDRMSRPADAGAAMEQARHLAGSNPHALAVLGAVLARRGEKGEARDVLERLERLSERRYVCSFDMARLHAALGESEAAMRYLERAYDERSTGMLFLRTGAFEGLRSNPRFAALLRKVEPLG